MERQVQCLGCCQWIGLMSFPPWGNLSAAGGSVPCSFDRDVIIANVLQMPSSLLTKSMMLGICNATQNLHRHGTRGHVTLMRIFFCLICNPCDLDFGLQFVLKVDNVGLMTRAST